jgi:hypothetical protein
LPELHCGADGRCHRTPAWGHGFFLESGHFDDVARLLATLDVDRTRKVATEIERRVLIDEFVEEILVLPDDLDVLPGGWAQGVGV